MEKTIIPIQLNGYEELFNELDARPISNRKVQDDVDEFIREALIATDKKNQVILQIHLPKEAQNDSSEAAAKLGIQNHYAQIIEFQKKISNIGVRRLIYYFMISTVLFIIWYKSQKIWGDNIFTTSLNTGATVVLWQAMSVIFIESSNYMQYRRINKKLATMAYEFYYD